VQHLKASFWQVLGRAVGRNLLENVTVLGAGGVSSSVSKAMGSLVASSSAASNQVPRLKAERFSSIAELIATVVNPFFVSTVEGLFTDSVLRMTNIGRDEHRLGNRLKDVFLIFLEFLTDGVMVPALRSATNILSRGIRARASTRGGRDGLPPLEVLGVLQVTSSAASCLKRTMECTLARGLEGSANMMVVCREALKGALKPLYVAQRDALAMFTACITLHVERLLQSLQNKGDYGVTFLSTANKTLYVLPSFLPPLLLLNVSFSIFINLIA
jgi:hypothetical protein